MIDTKELRRLAQAAMQSTTKERWMQARLDFMTAANPAAVSELLDRLEAAEKERDAAGKCADMLALALNTSNHERDALRAKIERMERQEPAYWGPKHAIEGGSTTVIVGKFPVNPTDAPLYALPGAKGE